MDKQLSKKVRLLLVMIILTIGVLFAGNVYAAGSFSVSTSGTSVAPGSTVTISIKVKNAAGKFTASSTDSSVLVVNSQPDFADNNTVTFKVTAKKSGSASIRVTPVDVTDYDLKAITGSKSVSITVKTAANSSGSSGTNSGTSSNSSSGTSGSNSGGNSNSSSENSDINTITEKSSIADLKKLKPSVGELVPKFDKKIKEYVIYVENEVDSIDFTVTKEDSKSTYVIKGNEKFKVGENNVTITVTAEDGTKSKYEIKVIRAEEFIMQLSTLSVTGYKLEPDFNPEVCEYKMDVASDVENIEIIAESNMENIPIEITGQDNLEIGENIVIITMRSADGSKTKEYKIIVNKVEKKNVLTSMAGFLNSNKPSNGQLLIAGVSLITIATITMLIIEGYKERRQKTTINSRGEEPIETIKSNKNNKGTFDRVLDSMDKLAKIEKSEKVKSGSGKHF